MLRLSRAGIIFFVLAVLSTAVVGIAELELLERSCNEDGTLTLTAKNPKDDPVFTDTITITARHADDIDPRAIDGVWDREWIVYAPSPERGVTRFQSAPGMLDDPGDYHVLVEYRGCRDDPRCKIALRLQSCPGERIRCSEEDVTTARCVVRGDMLYLYADAKHGFGIDAKKDLLFHVESSRRNLYGVHAFPGMTIDATETGYRIKLVLEEGEVISRAGVRREACSQDTVMVTCEEASGEERAEATATVVDIPKDASGTAQDDVQGGMETITGAVIGGDQTMERPFVSWRSMTVLLSIIAAGIAYLVHAGHARQKKRKQHLRDMTHDDELVVDDPHDE